MVTKLINATGSTPEAPAEVATAEVAELIRKLDAALRAGGEGGRSMPGTIARRAATSPALGEAMRRASLAALLSAAPAHEEASDLATDPIEAAARREAARSRDALRRRLRANAHAAYLSVQGSEEAALDAALAVVEAEWLSVRAEREAYAEALKVIRLYAQECEIRALAGRALDTEGAPPCHIGKHPGSGKRAVGVLHG